MSAIEFVASLDGLRAMREDWEGLAAQSRTPLLDHDWFVSAAEAFHDESGLRVAALRDSGTLQGIAPLALEPTGSGSRLTLLGASRLYEPGGWLFASRDALGSLLDAVLRLRCPLLLHRVPADSPLCRVASEVTRGRAVVVVRGSASTLGVPTRGAWQEYHASLSSRITENLPRVRRKAERVLGHVQVIETMPAPEEVDGLLETFATVEGSGWKGQGGSSLSHRPELRRFFRGYCRRAAMRKRLRVSSLLFGGHVAAMEIAVEAYARVWQLKIGYLDSLASYYPGLLLTESCIRSAFERSLDSYEFLGSAESWEERWRPDERRYRLLAAYPLSAEGMIGACRDAARVIWRRANAAVLNRPVETRA